ncbi:hypothetical protein FB567DRAFT_50475 [Paraphoma chrysanthemicola]|uniref:F-box domain-containing protein n=1 Tax=Paraphoma chrysanthemicola TaxID=798071 RepID=A0A8K0R718_9PLEO|nr:hypothetical protein FB567DRAFT_50475 [Paraphoma chrysanthemicola]
MNDFTSKQPRVRERDGREDVTNAVSVLNATQSPLLRLPGELRNKIYTFLCHPATIQLSGSHTDIDVTLYFSTLFRPYVALPRVSRLLRHETSVLNFTPTTIRCNTILHLLELMQYTSAAQRERVVELQLTGMNRKLGFNAISLRMCSNMGYVFHEMFQRVVKVECEEAAMQVWDRKTFEEWVRKDARKDIEIVWRRDEEIESVSIMR